MAEVAGLSITLDANVAPAESALQNFANTVAKIFGGVDASLSSVAATFNNATGKISESATASAGSITGMSASLETIEKDVAASANTIDSKLNPALESTQKEALQTGTALDTLAKKVKDSTAEAAAGTKMFVNNVGKLTAGSKEAGFALQSVGRVISDLPFGPGGIANNLEVLPTAFRAVSAAAKESGQSIGSILLKSLTGPGGLILAFSAVSAGLSIATFGLSAWTRLFGGNKKAVDDSTEALKKYREKLDDIDTSERRSAQTEIARLNVLTTIAQDATATYATRKRAVEDLQKAYPSYFGNLTTESALNADLTKNINEVTQALLNRAAAQAAEKKFAEASERVYDLQLKQREALKQSNAAAENLDKTYKRVNSSAALAAKESTAAVLQNAATNANAAKKSLDNVGKALDEARKEQLGFLNDARESAKAAGDGFFKPPPKDNKKSPEELRIERIKAALKDLGNERETIANNPITGPLEKVDEEIKAILSTVDKLIKLDVSPQDQLVTKLIGDVRQLNTRKLAVELQQAIEDATRISTPSTEGLKVKVTPELDKKAAEHVQEQVNRGNLFSTANRLKIPVTFEMDNAQLQAAINEKIKYFEYVGTSISNILTTPIESFFDALTSGSGNALAAFGNALKSIITRLVATAAAAAATAAILSLIPGFSLLSSTGAAVSGFQGLFSLLSGIPKFANGAIVSGPTLAMVGEYGGAKNNPEVIAPLNKLQSLMGNSGNGSVDVTGEFVIRGTDLVYVINQANKFLGR
jgi:hypothetical protein